MISNILLGPSIPLECATYIPKVGPANKVWVINLTLWIDMLSWSNDHCLGRGDIDERRLSWIRMRNPYRNGKSISGATEGHWYGARDMEEQGGAAVWKCYHGAK